MRGDRYQIALISLGVLVTALFAAFFYREIFPEYKLYQERYVALEKFRSTYTGEAPPPFKQEIKQIVFEPEDKGPAKIDRCISCHVAEQFEHFSPTQLKRDINGNLVLDKNGVPVKVPNDHYIWAKLDQKIKELEKTDPSEADRLRSLKTVKVGEHTYDVTKALAMHPLIGRETRPFEYHPIGEFGCTVCHGGNGRGLTTEKAHGPVYDGQYEPAFMGPEPQFIERDPENDPKFAWVFNDKPGDELLFQTSPLLVGDLIQANCVQCHQSGPAILESSVTEASVVAERREEKTKAVNEAYEREKAALASLLTILREIDQIGYRATLSLLEEKSEDYSLPAKEREEARSQLKYLQEDDAKQVVKRLQRNVVDIVGSETLAQKIQNAALQKGADSSKLVDSFIRRYADDPQADGTLFSKKAAVLEDKKLLFHVKESESRLAKSASDPILAQAFVTQVDALTQTYHEGKGLFLSQACYACHRVEGFSRGGIGPELTEIGNFYPWYIKESLVWPQSNLKTSQMPNFRMDPTIIEKLMTYLLSLRGRPESISETAYRVEVADWEKGKQMPWEKPINPGKLQDLRYSMTIFGTEGCASCHRLKGFESDTGFAVEKQNPDWNTLFEERQWFQEMIPEMITGSELAKAIDRNQKEIDARIVNGVREGSILEEIEENHPGLIESFYTPFLYAGRAKNSELKGEELKQWKERVRRVLMMYVQEYGYGRLIGPRPNWSGVYRSNEWLIQHFRKPSALAARSLMPVMPFDDSKFYALTYMLDVLGKKNRDAVRQIWENRGFDPTMAYEIYCSQCHGEFLHGNGPVSEWIYPIPKNLRNADFLRNLTKERVNQSIVHGVKGGPMPPWGETPQPKPGYDGIPVMTEEEIGQLVDWLFASLLGGTVIRGPEDVPKWQYGPDDALEEIRKEGNVLKPGPLPEFIDLREVKPDLSAKPPVKNEEVALLDKLEENPEKPANRVEEVFTRKRNREGPDEYSYYIKKKYYTQQNIEEGQRFFELNCAVCHGKEADGAGFRAGTMFDAKPRMLVNLQWIDTRDDLRLLRSIKYGVRGTSMTPWGDQTSSLQRMQLVIYIRTLAMEQNQRDQLFDAVYQVFDVADQTLNQARIQEYQVINQIQEELDRVSAEREKLLEQVEAGEADPNSAIQNFEKQLKWQQKLASHKAADALLVELKNIVHEEGEVYRLMGVNLINKTIVGVDFDAFVDAILVDNGEYSVKNGLLDAHFDPAKEEAIKRDFQKVMQGLDERIEKDNASQRVIEGRIASPQRDQELAAVKAKVQALNKLKQDLLSGFEEAQRLRNRQEELVAQYKKQIQALQK